MFATILCTLCFLSSFSKTEEGDVHLFTISVPISLPNKAHRLSYLCRWSVDTWETEQVTLYKGDLLTALAVR